MNVSLKALVEALIAKDESSAKQAFHEYATNVVSKLINSVPEEDVTDTDPS